MHTLHTKGCSNDRKACLSLTNLTASVIMGYFFNHVPYYNDNISKLGIQLAYVARSDKCRESFQVVKNKECIKSEYLKYKMYRKGTSIRQAPVFWHLRALWKSPWKFINYLDE